MHDDNWTDKYTSRPVSARSSSPRPQHRAAARKHREPETVIGQLSRLMKPWNERWDWPRIHKLERELDQLCKEDSPT